MGGPHGTATATRQQVDRVSAPEKIPDAQTLISDLLGAEVIADTGPAPAQVRQLPHGLSAVLIPRNHRLRRAYGLPPRPSKRKTT
jgi:hypothetical protein